MQGRRRARDGTWVALVGLLVVVGALVVAAGAYARGRRGSPPPVGTQPLSIGQASAPTASATVPGPTSTTMPLTAADVRVSETVVPETGRPCTVMLAPQGERYICWSEEAEVWLGTLSGGIGRLLFKEMSHVSWAYDDRHLLVSPMSDPYASAQPQPVYLYDVDSGQRTELGKTVRGWLMRTTTTGYVSYPAEGGIEIVNPILGTKQLVSLGGPVPQPQTPVATVEAPGESGWPEFLRATTTTAAMVSPLPQPTPGPTAASQWANYPNFQAFHEVSSDGAMMAILGVSDFGASLWLIDVASGERQPVSSSVLHWATHPFAFSPDGAHLAFAEASADSYARGLTVMDIASGERRELLRGEMGGCLDWLHWLSPGLLFYGHRTGHGTDDDAYYLIGTAGGESKLLWTGGNGAGVAFSSDGHLVSHYRTGRDWDTTLAVALGY